MAGLVVQRSYHGQHEKRIEQLEFSEQIEKLSEVAVIIILGTILLVEPMLKYAGQSLLTAGLLFFIVRPVGVWLSTLGGNLPKKTRSLIGWFGIRGLGSIYYLTYVLGEGLKGDVAEQIAWITYTVVVFSIILHGVSAAPLMIWYEKIKQDPKSSIT